jgi:ankyrin repeat protein
LRWTILKRLRKTKKWFSGILMPLVKAAALEREAVVKLLLENGATLQSKEHGGYILLWAARKGHEAVVDVAQEGR